MTNHEHSPRKPLPKLAVELPQGHKPPANGYDVRRVNKGGGEIAVEIVPLVDPPLTRPFNDHTGATAGAGYSRDAKRRAREQAREESEKTRNSSRK